MVLEVEPNKVVVVELNGEIREPSVAEAVRDLDAGTLSRGRLNFGIVDNP